MAYFDFHNLLSTDDFERLACDVLNIRENGLEFKTYAKGRDGGVDVKCINDDRKIIGQAKLHPSNSFRSLRTELKNEVLKCKKLEPDRYIVITSVSLTPAQTAEIIELFGGYIKEERDVIDRNLLNDYLSRPDYEGLKMQYSNLLVPDLSYVTEIIDNIVNNGIRVQTKRELDELREFHNLYYNTQLFKSALEKLRKDRVIILTGNPGVGKTTTARMLLQNLLVDEGNSLYCLNSLQQFDDVFRSGKKQIFLLDDFWGSQFSPELANRDYVKELLKVVKSVHNSDSHYLILTSRTYIINAVLNHADPDLKKALEIDNFVLSVADYNDEDSIRILLNHLQFYGFGREYFEYLMYDKEFYRYIHHPNYSPRHVEYFIKYIYPNPENRWKFFDKFFDYLKNPHLYWDQVFARQTDTAKLILLILLSTSDPIEVNDLRCVFDRTQKLARAELNLAVNPLDFGTELKNLDELFVVSDKSYYEVSIRFQNPGIKDYLLQYLRKHIDQWGKVLIEGAVFFNQFFYVFSTMDETLDDYYSQTPFENQKIVLSSSLQGILKEKIFREFDTMEFSTNKFNSLTDDLSREDGLQEIRQFKLLMLERLFVIAFNENKDVKQFILTRVQEDIEALRSKKGLANKAMRRLPTLLVKIQPYYDLDTHELVRLYHENIEWASEYLSFMDFAQMDEAYFANYLKENIRSIRKDIRRLILDEGYYGFDDSQDEFVFVNEEIEALFDKYGMRFTRKYVEQINDSLESYTFIPENGAIEKFIKAASKKSSGKIKKRSSGPRKQEPNVASIIREYIGADFDPKFYPIQYIKDYSPNKVICNRLLKELKNRGSIVSGFDDCGIAMHFLIDFVSDVDLKFKSLDEFEFLQRFSRYLFDSQPREGTYEKWLQCLSEISLEFFENSNCTLGHRYYSKDELVCKFRGLINDPEMVYPFFIPKKSWYRFLSHSLVYYYASVAVDGQKEDATYRESALELAQHQDWILNYIERLDPRRFNAKIMSYEMNKHLSSLDFSSSRSLVMSFLRISIEEIDMTWDKKHKRFEEQGCGGGDAYFEVLIKHLGIDFESYYLHFSFFKDYHDEKNAKDFFLDFSPYPELYEKVVEILPSNKAKFGVDVYSINIVEFASVPANYEILKRMGLERYVIHIVRQLLSRLHEKYGFENGYANSPCLQRETPL